MVLWLFGGTVWYENDEMMKWYNNWDLFQNNLSLIIIEAGDGYVRIMALFSQLLYVFKIFYGKNKNVFGYG